LGLIANDNGRHHWEPKFDNENKHYRLHINIFQIFLTQFHEQEQILNRSLKRVG
jgi:hypothetical protein